MIWKDWLIKFKIDSANNISKSKSIWNTVPRLTYQFQVCLLNCFPERSLESNCHWRQCINHLLRLEGVLIKLKSENKGGNVPLTQEKQGTKKDNCDCWRSIISGVSFHNFFRTDTANQFHWASLSNTRSLGHSFLEDSGFAPKLAATLEMYNTTQKKICFTSPPHLQQLKSSTPKKSMAAGAWYLISFKVWITHITFKSLPWTQKKAAMKAMIINQGNG